MWGDCTRRSALTFALLAALLVAPTSLVAQDSARIVVKTGVEHDSNARRIVGTEQQSDQLLRAFLKGELHYGIGALGELDARILLGGKFLVDIADEDAFVSSARLSWSKTLFAVQDFGVAIFARGDFGDRSERSSTRDYMRAGAVGGASARWGPVSAAVAGGYRAFIYKPDLDSNHRGASAEAVLNVVVGWGIGLSLSYAFIERNFDVLRFVQVGDLVAEDPDNLREDRLHAGRFAVNYRGPFLLSASYGLQINTSNAFGPGLVRHTGEVTWTQPLWFDLIFDVTGRIQRTLYDDPVRIDETLQIDDDDRNMIVTGLAVPVPATDGILSFELRYSLFTEALDDDADFVRHLFYLGLSADLDALDAP